MTQKNSKGPAYLEDYSIFSRKLQSSGETEEEESNDNDPVGDTSVFASALNSAAFFGNWYTTNSLIPVIFRCIKKGITFKKGGHF